MSGVVRGRPRRSADVVWANLDGEAVLLEVRNTRSYTLNRVATCMWEACDGRATMGEIEAGLDARLGVSTAMLAEDFHRLVFEMSEAGLITMEEE